jgi:thiosulfate/3-mercaptopyruvate sulfurtransferase
MVCTHLSAAAVALAVVAACNRTPVPIAGTNKPDAGSMLVQAEELRLALTRPGVRILDTRSADAYAKGHVPGAVRVEAKDWQKLATREGGVTDGPAWAELVGRLGLAPGTRVVVYGASLTDTARVWWTLKYLGLANVAILDGGWDRWVKLQLPSDTAIPTIASTPFEPKFQADRLAEIEPLKASVDNGDVTVVDARSLKEFTGEDARGPRGGHIPGAKHLEWKELLAEDGRFKSPEQLRTLFRRRGIEPEQTAVTC